MIPNQELIFRGVLMLAGVYVSLKIFFLIVQYFIKNHFQNISKRSKNFDEEMDQLIDKAKREQLIFVKSNNVNEPLIKENNNHQNNHKNKNTQQNQSSNTNQEVIHLIEKEFQWGEGPLIKEIQRDFMKKLNFSGENILWKNYLHDIKIIIDQNKGKKFSHDNIVNMIQGKVVWDKILLEWAKFPDSNFVNNWAENWRLSSEDLELGLKVFMIKNHPRWSLNFKFQQTLEILLNSGQVHEQGKTKSTNFSNSSNSSETLEKYIAALRVNSSEWNKWLSHHPLKNPQKNYILELNKILQLIHQVLPIKENLRERQVEEKFLAEDLNLLGLSSPSNIHQVKKQFGALAQRSHPDKMGQMKHDDKRLKEVNEKFSQYKSAYDRLRKFYKKWENGDSNLLKIFNQNSD